MPSFPTGWLNKKRFKCVLDDKHLNLSHTYSIFSKEEHSSNASFVPVASCLVITVTPHHTTSLCSVMLIIFSCCTVWMNITMTLTSSQVGADITSARSSLITFLLTSFCTGEWHFILRFQSGFRLCEYSTDWSPPPPLNPRPLPSACRNPPNPIWSTSDISCKRPHSPSLGPLGVDALSPSGHRILRCLCALVRWRCCTVSWCDRARAGRHACDSKCRCPPLM